MNIEQPIPHRRVPRRFRLMPYMVCAMLLAGWSSLARACPVCYGDSQDPLVKGVEAGVIVLVVVIYGVLTMMLGVVGMWFVRARRIRKSLDTPHGRMDSFVRHDATSTADEDRTAN